MMLEDRTRSTRYVDIINMGCSKNLVDSERLARMFEARGFKPEINPVKITAPTVVINTCGFIGDAKEESIDMILQCTQVKKVGNFKRRVYVMGCLSERYRDQLKAEIPEITRMYGKFDWDQVIDDIIKDTQLTRSGMLCDDLVMPYERKLEKSCSGHAYIKIAEGCNRFCAFCAIPLITGRYKSRPIEDIIDEVKWLIKEKGVREFNIIAQDLSYYGMDIYGKHALAELIDTMAQVPGVQWIRLHYAYPTDFPYDILPVMAKHPNVCKYLDIALQHISDKVLANMNRHITGEETRQLLARIRREVPGIHIRTTLMVGFPGEGEEEFEELKQFVREQRFERMGAFAYCEEDDTYAAKNFKDEIPQEVKQARLDELMAIQQEISEEINQQKIGKTLKCRLDESEFDPKEKVIINKFRTEFDSPEVDGQVYIVTEPDPDKLMLSSQQLYDIHIQDADEFDLYGYLAETED